MKGDSKVLVECQLCFQCLYEDEVLGHLISVHRIEDKALYNKKPLAQWYRVAAG